MGGVKGGIYALIGYACRSFPVVTMEYEWFLCSTSATPWDKGLNFIIGCLNINEKLHSMVFIKWIKWTNKL